MFGFGIDIFVLSSVFVLSIFWRKKIATWMKNIPLPLFLIYLISSLPFIVFEEFINCIECFPFTIIWLLFFVFVLGVLVRISGSKRMLLITLGFSAFGVLFEVFLGRSTAGIDELSPSLLIFMLFWIGLSYAFLVIVPLTVLINGKKK